MAKLTDNLVYVFPTSDSLVMEIAEDFARRAVLAVKNKDSFLVVLSGGETPKLFYDILTTTERLKNQIPWKKIKFFFGDERYVPPNSSNSNYQMAYTHLFSKVPVLMENVYRIPTEFKNPEDAATNYENTLRQVLELHNNEYPEFDVIYLGLGQDGHTASLMPESNIVLKYSYEKNNIVNDSNSKQLVASLWVSEQNMYRITLTPPTINNAFNIIFIVMGKDKSFAVNQVLEGSNQPITYPAQLVRCVHGKNIWYLDSLAASELKL